MELRENVLSKTILITAPTAYHLIDSQVSGVIIAFRVAKHCGATPVTHLQRSLAFYAKEPDAGSTCELH